MPSGIWLRKSAVAPGIWVYGSGRVCGKHFLCRNAASGTEVEKLLENPREKWNGCKRILHSEGKSTEDVSK